MTNYLDSNNFPSANRQASFSLDQKLASLLDEPHGDFYELLAGYQRILADNRRQAEWAAINEKLRILFMCGLAMPLDGPMIGIPMSLRDSDFFLGIARTIGQDRSVLASVEVLAKSWNATFADTGLWMGKTFEPVTREVVRDKCNDAPEVMVRYDEKITRIGRNFFREVADPNPFQSLGLPAITQAWKLKDRPAAVDAQGFEGILLQQNLDKEKAIPYDKTGGYYLADLGTSVLAEMSGKQVYALNYRWKNLHPSFPMTCLVDEIVQIHEGIYLGQLIYATRHFSLGELDLPPFGHLELGEPYTSEKQDYGYQNNGYFLMMDPVHASQIYAAFPRLRPRPGEAGYGAGEKR